MTHDPTENEPIHPALTAPTPAIRHDGWTAAKQVAFLRMLAATQSVSAAAKSVGMGRQSAYKLRARLEDGPFGAGWRMAVGSGQERLVEAALDRAINGVEVPHYWQGELVGTSRRYDERLTGLLLASGALRKGIAPRDPSESDYASGGLARLLERIECGPAEWTDYESEQAFYYGDDMSDLAEAHEEAEPGEP